MEFQEIFVHVEICCPGQKPVRKRIDVLQIAGRFDCGMILRELQNEYPGCSIQLIDIEWVVSKNK